MKPAAIYLPIVGLIAAYTSDENEQLYFDKCFSEKGYSDEEYDLGNDNKLPSDRQTKFDSDVADCNNTAWSEEIVEDSLDILQLSLPGLGSLIVYAIKGYKPTQKKPKKRGVESNEKYTDDEASFKKWMAKQNLTGTPTKSNIGGFNLNGKNYQLNSDNSGFE
jgi:hypothetical protein